MNAFDYLNRSAEEVEGKLCEDTIVNGSGVRTVISFQVVDGKKFLQTLETMEKEEQNEQSPPQKDKLRRLEQLKAKHYDVCTCEPELYLTENILWKMMLGKQIIQWERATEKDKLVKADKDFRKKFKVDEPESGISCATLDDDTRQALVAIAKDAKKGIISEEEGNVAISSVMDRLISEDMKEKIEAKAMEKAKEAKEKKDLDRYGGLCDGDAEV